ncbi:MAG: acyltransferase family protein [Lachnospiraceae bacterium]|nr:acyltransferase family protein [Lachnospiraceae bacterium]
MSETSTKSKRKDYLDLLRILASYTVVIGHITTQYMYAVTPGSHEGISFRAYVVVCDMCIPLFCMISGALFLSRQIPIEKMFKKYILRIVLIFIFWSLLYSVLFEHSNGLGTLLSSFVRGYSHLWFLYMIVGLYIVTPILAKIAQDETLLKYFIVIGVIFFLVIPEALQLLSLVSEKSAQYLSSAYSNMGMQTVSGYALFYMLGYYLDKLDKKKILPIPVLFICFIAALVIPILLNSVYCLHNDQEISILLSNFSVGNLIRSSCAFLIVKHIYDWDNSGEHPVIFFLGKISLGAYLIHQMVIILLNHKAGINSLTFDPVYGVPLVSLIVFIIAYILSFLVSKIPFLNKTIGI